MTCLHHDRLGETGEITLQVLNEKGVWQDFFEGFSIVNILSRLKKHNPSMSLEGIKAALLYGQELKSGAIHDKRCRIKPTEERDEYVECFCGHWVEESHAGMNLDGSVMCCHACFVADATTIQQGYFDWHESELSKMNTQRAAEETAKLQIYKALGMAGYRKGWLTVGEIYQKCEEVLGPQTGIP